MQILQSTMILIAGTGAIHQGHKSVLSAALHRLDVACSGMRIDRIDILGLFRNHSESAEVLSAHLTPFSRRGASWKDTSCVRGRTALAAARCPLTVWKVASGSDARPTGQHISGSHSELGDKQTLN